MTKTLVASASASITVGATTVTLEERCGECPVLLLIIWWNNFFCGSVDFVITGGRNGPILHSNDIWIFFSFCGVNARQQSMLYLWQPAHWLPGYRRQHNQDSFTPLARNTFEALSNNIRSDDTIKGNGHIAGFDREPLWKWILELPTSFKVRSISLP